MQVFSEIAMEARQRALEHSGISTGSAPSQGQGQGIDGAHRAPGQSGIPRRFPRPAAQPAIGGEETWGEDDGSRREREEELAREREYDQDVKMLDRDGRFASDSEYTSGSFPSSSSPSASQPAPKSPQSSSTVRTGGNVGSGGSTWDRLRQKAFPGQSQTSTDAGSDGMRTGREGTVDTMRSGEMRDTGSLRVDPERSREQREFDEMLERERRGEGETETWK